MKLATAAVSAVALLALAAPAFAEAMSSSSYWENMRRSQPARESRPYALTGNSPRSDDEGFRVCTGWTGANRERRPIFKHN